MQPWPPRRWGTGDEQAPDEAGPSAGGGPGPAWSVAHAAGAPGSPREYSPRARRPSWSRDEAQPSLGAEQPRGAPGRCRPRRARPKTPRRARHVALLKALPPPAPLSPRVAWEVAPSRMALPAPWDPNYEPKAGTWLLGGRCSSCTSFTCRTLCHPTFWPMYEPALLRGPENRELLPCDAGAGLGAPGSMPGETFSPPLPALRREDFLLDPLLPAGQRVPLYLSPQQVSGRRSLAWLTGPELIALTGLLLMSQGEPRRSPPDRGADHSGPSGDRNCPHGTDPSPPGSGDPHTP
ncbi:histone deacetylase complex subunit SAP25 isoform X2 [Erinaceus europaeus]|uniref:Histone deacetylase complex subunit SAP25 isoform X2 n=1 Tax=Erinaceus europaeus TaxID=9365 RepID=A0ABM3VYJ2_ERIEU|nr:histone deacetylase complex subunit SAP25 isoform X2 [Erinaceus europaeus]